MPNVSLRFIDGKHRFLAYRDLGLRCIPLLVPTAQRRLFRRLFRPPKKGGHGARATRRRTLRAQPENATFDPSFMAWGRPGGASTPRGSRDGGAFEVLERGSSALSDPGDDDDDDDDDDGDGDDEEGRPSDESDGGDGTSELLGAAGSDAWPQVQVDQDVMGELMQYQADADAI